MITLIEVCEHQSKSSAPIIDIGGRYALLSVGISHYYSGNQCCPTGSYYVSCLFYLLGSSRIARYLCQYTRSHNYRLARHILRLCSYVLRLSVDVELSLFESLALLTRDISRCSWHGYRLLTLLFASTQYTTAARMHKIKRLYRSVTKPRLMFCPTGTLLETSITRLPVRCRKCTITRDLLGNNPMMVCYWIIVLE